MRWFPWRRKKTPNTPASPGAAMLESSPTMMIAGRERVVGLPYNLPVDLEELNRLDFQHYLLRYAFQGLYAAPVNQQIASILDVGTGTGRWAVEMAQLFPRTRVVGLDVKAPAVDERAGAAGAVDMRPPNYTFEAGNVLEGLPYADGSFDFVHMRLLFSAVPHDRWPHVARELARVTRPGGWVESVEATALENGSPSIELLWSWIAQASARRGVDLRDGGIVAEHLRAAGLVNVATHRIAIPTGQYGDRLGRMAATDFFAVCKGFSGVAIAQGFTTQEFYDQTLAAGQQDLDTPAYRCVTPFYIAVGQRLH
jgi:ubiquinone/menaquinone biosynthesis C-methylase UbiE